MAWWLYSGPPRTISCGAYAARSVAMGHVLVNPTIVGGQGLSIEATNKLRMTQK